MVAAAIILVVAGIVTGIIPIFIKIPSNATVKTLGVGVFWDRERTRPVTSIDWGVIEPGEDKSVVVFIQNQANVPTKFGLSTANWTPPEASNYISLTWNYTYDDVWVDAVVPVEMTLHVADSITGIENFSFDIIIKVVG